MYAAIPQNEKEDFEPDRFKACYAYILTYHKLSQEGSCKRTMFQTGSVLSLRLLVRLDEAQCIMINGETTIKIFCKSGDND